MSFYGLMKLMATLLPRQCEVLHLEVTGILPIAGCERPGSISRSWAIEKKTSTVMLDVPPIV